MAGKVDIQVAIGADASPLQREVGKARGSVHGLARDVESFSKGMVLAARQPAAGMAVSARKPAADITSAAQKHPADMAMAAQKPLAGMAVSAQKPPAGMAMETRKPSAGMDSATRKLIADMASAARKPTKDMPMDVRQPPADIAMAARQPAADMASAARQPPVQQQKSMLRSAPAMMLPPATSQFGAYFDQGESQSKPKKPSDVRGSEKLANAEKVSAASVAASAAKAEAAEKASAAKRAIIAEKLAAEKAKYAAKAAAADAQAVAKIQVIEKAAAAKRADYAASLAAEKERIALRDEKKMVASADRVARAEIAAAQKGADGAARIRAGARESAVAANAAAARGTAAQRGVLANVIRRPEFNFMGRMEGLLGGFTLGGLLMWTRGAQAAAAETRNLAVAARLPMEEFLRLQQAAKDSGTPVEQLNAAIKDYAEGRITLEQVGESVGLIGYRAGMASDEIKRLADSTRELAEMDKQFKTLQEGAANFGKSAVVGLGKFFQQVSRMGIESVAQGRAVSWSEAGEMMKGEREQEVRAETRKAEKALRETRAKIRVEADLTDFFGDVEREAEKQKKIKLKTAAADEGLRERIARITVAGPKAGDSLARIGGYMGGRMDNRGILLAERTLKVAEEQAQHQKELVKIMGGDS